MTSERSARSYAPLTLQDLERLATLAETDHLSFTRPGVRGHAWRNRRVAVVLAQGGAMHYLDGTTGLKDIDVWTFYAKITDMPLRAGTYHTTADFGPSIHGRQEYPPGLSHRRLKTWTAYEGRRIDFLVRDLPVEANASIDEVTEALRLWLTAGAKHRSNDKGEHSTPRHLAQKAMVWLTPGAAGAVIWPSDPGDSEQKHK